MALMRTDFTQSLVKRGYEVFWDKYPEIDDVWTALYNERNIETPYYEASSMIGLGDLEEKPEGEPFSNDQPADGWPVLGRVRTFGRRISFSMELYEDTQVENLFADTVGQWSESYQRTRDRFYARFFNEGAYTAGSPIFNNTIPGVKTDPTGPFIYDGKPFFADAANPHPCKMADLTMVNYLPLSLTYENFMTAYNQMTLMNSYDEKGDEINLVPDTLLIHPKNQFKAKEILGSTYLPHTETTPSIANPLKNIVPNVIQWRRLADPDSWFLLARARGMHALKRKDIELDVWIDQETKEVIATVNCRFGGYVDNHRYAIACNGPQAAL